MLFISVIAISSISNLEVLCFAYGCSTQSKLLFFMEAYINDGFFALSMFLFNVYMSIWCF